MSEMQRISGYIRQSINKSKMPKLQYYLGNTIWRKGKNPLSGRRSLI